MVINLIGRTAITDIDAGDIIMLRSALTLAMNTPGINEKDREKYEVLRQRMVDAINDVANRL